MKTACEKLFKQNVHAYTQTAHVLSILSKYLILNERWTIFRQSLPQYIFSYNDFHRYHRSLPNSIQKKKRKVQCLSVLVLPLYLISSELYENYLVVRSFPFTLFCDTLSSESNFVFFTREILLCVLRFKNFPLALIVFEHSWLACTHTAPHSIF